MSLESLLPPPIVQRLMGYLSPEEQQEFSVADQARRDDLLLVAAERAGLIPPADAGPPPGAALGPGLQPGQGPPGIVNLPGAGPGPVSDTGPGGMPAPPDVPLPPAGAMPPVGPAGPGGPLGTAGGPPPLGPPPGAPVPDALVPPTAPPRPARPPRPPRPEASGPKLAEKPKPPEDWEPETLEDIQGPDYPWQAAPTYEELATLAQEALDDTFWQERNMACYLQSRCYYRSKDYYKLDNSPMSSIMGDMLYMLATPAKQIDRIVARCKADTSHLTFQLDQRSEDEAWEQAAAAAESWARDQWSKHVTGHWDDVSQHGPDAGLDRKLPLLGAVHGTAGWSLRTNTRRRKGKRKRDVVAERPLVLQIIPWHELYPLGGCTLRIQSLTLREARRLSHEVRTRWPERQDADNKDRQWYPPDEHRCRFIGFSDRAGRWYCQCFDLVAPTAPTGRRAREDNEDDRFWLVEPEEVGYGFCVYQCPPGWQSTGDTALPDGTQAADNYGRNFARGALYANLYDFVVQDQAASYALSIFRYNRNPAFADIVDAKSRQELGEPPAVPFEMLEGERKTRLPNEGPQPVPKHFADNASDNFFLSMTFGQTADTFPAALGGGGEAQSGYDRRQMVENAQVLHVQEVRDWCANVVEAICRRSLELVARLGTGKKKVLADLPFARQRGGVGEGRLTVDDLGRAGVGIQVDYHEEDLEIELRKNAIYIPRFKEKLDSAETTRENLGTREPKREEERVDEEMALSHPAMQEVRAIAALMSRPEWLPFLLDALQRNAQGQKLAVPGGGPTGTLPSPNGGPPPPGPPPPPEGQPGLPGVPQGALPTAEIGLPPGMPVPNGVGR